VSFDQKTKFPPLLKEQICADWRLIASPERPAPRVPRVATLRQPRRSQLTAFRRIPIPPAAGLPAGCTQNRSSRGDRLLQSAQANASAHRGCSGNGSALPPAFAADNLSEVFLLCLPPRSEYHIRTGRA